MHCGVCSRRAERPRCADVISPLTPALFCGHLRRSTLRVEPVDCSWRFGPRIEQPLCRERRLFHRANTIGVRRIRNHLFTGEERWNMAVALQRSREFLIRLRLSQPEGFLGAYGAVRTYSSTFFPSTSSGTLPPRTTVSLNAFRSNRLPSAAFALSRWRLISLWPTL